MILITIFALVSLGLYMSRDDNTTMRDILLGYVIFAGIPVLLYTMA